MVLLLLYSLVDNEKNTLGLPAVPMTCGCAVAIRRASPNRAQPGLPPEPLNVSIGQLLAPYRPGTSAMVIHGGVTTNTIKKTFS